MQFSDDELKVLDLGLKFAPDKTLDKLEVYIDLQKFMRKLNLKKHFALNVDNRILEHPEYVQTNLRNNSMFNPKTPGSQCLGEFKKMVEDDLRKLAKKDTRTNNIWKTIKEIGKKHEVVIRPTDKGGGLVILSKKDYKDKMENLLRVENTYKKLKVNPKNKYEKKLKTFVKKGKDMGILSIKEAEYLVSNSVLRV